MGDDGLCRAKQALQHLPLGETKVTDAGLVHVEMKRLKYLGLRGNKITDSGIPRQAAEFDRAHLGEAGITDKGTTAGGGRPTAKVVAARQADRCRVPPSRLKQLQSLYPYQAKLRSTACAACKRRCRNTHLLPLRHRPGMSGPGETVWHRA